MSWTHATLLVVLLALSLSQGTDAAAVPDGKDTAKATDSRGSLNKIFMQEADASNFFRRRTRRWAKSQDELDAEQRQVLLADQRKRQYHEENMKEHESYAEEEGDEQDERSRESTEQWRQFHNDGMYPPYEYNRHTA